MASKEKKIENVLAAIKDIDAKAKKLEYRRRLLVGQADKLKAGLKVDSRVPLGDSNMGSLADSPKPKLIQEKVPATAKRLADAVGKPNTCEVWEKVLQLILDVERNHTPVQNGNKFYEMTPSSLKEECGTRGISQADVASVFERFQCS